MGTRLARAPNPSGWRWIPAPDPDPPVAVDLAPWLRSEQLQWIEPFDQRVALRSGTDGCPGSAELRAVSLEMLEEAELPADIVRAQLTRLRAIWDRSHRSRVHGAA